MAKKKMSPLEFKEKMQEIFPSGNYDAEQPHAMADDLIIELLKQLGYKDGAEIFEQAEKWYA